MALMRIPWSTLRDNFVRVYPHLGYVALKRYSLVDATQRETLVARIDMLDDAVDLWIDTDPPDQLDVRNEEMARSMGLPVESQSPDELREAVNRGEAVPTMAPGLQASGREQTDGEGESGLGKVSKGDDVDDEEADDVDDEVADDIDEDLPAQRRDTTFTLHDALEATRRCLIISAEQNTPIGQAEKFRVEYWKYGGTSRLWSHVITYRSSSLPIDVSPEETHSEVIARFRAEEEAHRNRQRSAGAEAQATLTALREVGVIEDEKPAKRARARKRSKNEPLEILSAVEMLEERMDDETYDDPEESFHPEHSQPGQLSAEAVAWMENAGPMPPEVQAVVAATLQPQAPVAHGPMSHPISMAEMQRHHAIMMDMQSVWLQTVTRTASDLLGVSHASHAQATRTAGTFVNQMAKSLDASRNQTDGLIDTFQAKQINDLAAQMETEKATAKTQAASSALQTFIEQGMSVAKAVALHKFAKQQQVAPGAQAQPPAQVQAPHPQAHAKAPEDAPAGASAGAPAPGAPPVQPTVGVPEGMDLGDWLLSHPHVIEAFDDPHVRNFLADAGRTTELQGLAKAYSPAPEPENGSGFAEAPGAEVAEPPELEDDLAGLTEETETPVVADPPAEEASGDPDLNPENSEEE